MGFAGTCKFFQGCLGMAKQHLLAFDCKSIDLMLWSAGTKGVRKEQGLVTKVLTTQTRRVCPA